MTYTKQLKAAAILTAGTLTLFISSIASAGHLVRKEVLHPNWHTTVVNKRVCGHNGCVNVHKIIKYRRNGTKKIIKKHCRHGYCNTQVSIRS